MNKYILVGLSLLIGAGTAFAAGRLISLTGKASYEVNVVGGHNQFDKYETKFLDDSYTQELYQFTAHTWGATDADGYYQEGTIQQYKAGKLAYTKKVKGADFEIFGDEFVQVTEYGCCDSPDINRLYKRSTGEQVEAAMNSSTLEFQVPNSKVSYRYLASVVDGKAPEKRGTKSYIGTISYFDGQTIKARVRIYAELAAGEGTQLFDSKPVLNAKDEVQGHTVTVWSADKSADPVQAYSGIGIKGSAYVGSDEQSFSIVVTGDQLDRSRSSASPKLELDFQ